MTSNRGSDRKTPLSEELLRALEVGGYTEAPQPASMSLQLYQVQRQMLAWMIDQEQLDLNEQIWTRVEIGGEQRWYTPFLDGSGLAFRSEPPAPTSGGIIGADPGFGKTPTLIALILARPSAQLAAGAAAAASGATLVVVPLSLVAQWRDEISKAQLELLPN